MELGTQLIVLTIVALVTLLLLMIPVGIYLYFRNKAKKFSKDYPLTERDLVPYEKNYDKTEDEKVKKHWIISYLLFIIYGIVISVVYCMTLDCFKEWREIPVGTRVWLSAVYLCAYAFFIYLPYYFAYLKRGVAYLLYFIIATPLVIVSAFAMKNWELLGWPLFLLHIAISSYFLFTSFRLFKANDNRKYRSALALQEKYGMEKTSFWKRIWIPTA